MFAPVVIALRARSVERLVRVARVVIPLVEDIEISIDARNGSVLGPSLLLERHHGDGG